MKTPCKLDTFIVRGYGGHTPIWGWRLGDWAAHLQLANPNHWCLTHLPTALCLPLVWASFERLEQAVEAMQEIVSLKNSWAYVTQSDMTKELGEKMRSICLRHGAIEGPIQIVQDMDKSELGIPSDRRFNGYGDAAWPE